MNTLIPPLEEAMLCSLALLFDDQKEALRILEEAFRLKNQKLVLFDSHKNHYRVCRETAVFFRNAQKSRGFKIPLDILIDFLYIDIYSIYSTESPQQGSQGVSGFFTIQCLFDGTSENHLLTHGI